LIKSLSRIRFTHPAHTAAMILAAGALLWGFWTLFVPTRVMQSGDQPLTIQSGQSLVRIAHKLEQQDIVRSSGLFRFYVAARGWSRDLQAGEYLIPQGAPMYEVARALAKGTASNDVEVVIPEGYNIWEIDRRLTEAGFATGTDFARAYHLDDGVFFPDTYRFRKGSTIVEISQKMRENFDLKTKTIFANLSNAERRRILIIASMLEKEARSMQDMRLVSGVIQNRLKTGMNLAVDATVSYGACVRQYTKSLTRNCQVQLIPVGTEVKIDSPFNTYTRPGLPPRPIANPGLNAIRAAMNPLKSDYFYYLSTRDGSQIIYSRTAAEHAANRRKYLGL